jgi:hypothetical protein
LVIPAGAVIVEIEVTPETNNIGVVGAIVDAEAIVGTDADTLSGTVIVLVPVNVEVEVTDKVVDVVSPATCNKLFGTDDPVPIPTLPPNGCNDIE